METDVLSEKEPDTPPRSTAMVVVVPSVDEKNKPVAPAVDVEKAKAAPAFTLFSCDSSNTRSVESSALTPVDINSGTVSDSAVIIRFIEYLHVLAQKNDE